MVLYRTHFQAPASIAAFKRLVAGDLVNVGEMKKIKSRVLIDGAENSRRIRCRSEAQ